MEYIDISLLVLLLEYAVYAVGLGVAFIILLELMVFGIMKAFSLLKTIV